MTQVYDITTMTVQEVFEASARHLFNQGWRSLADDNYSCSYRGSGGRMCAAGIFITDYDDSMEDVPWHILVRTGRVPKDHINLISQLQSVHDSVPTWKDVETLRSALRKVAARYSLNGYFLNDLKFGPDRYV